LIKIRFILLYIIDMKKVLYLLGFLVPFLVNAQTVDSTYLSGSTQSNRVIARNDFAIDGVTYIGMKDTNFIPSKNGAIVFKVSNLRLYIYINRWLGFYNTGDTSHIHVTQQGQGTNVISGHDSTLVGKGQKDSGNVYQILYGDSTMVNYSPYNPTVQMRNEMSIILTNNTVFDGNSITAGYSLSSPTTQAYPYQIASSLGLTGITNRAVSNSTVLDLLSRQFANDPATNVTWAYSIMIGENNFGEDSSVSKYTTVSEGIRTAIVNHFMDTILAISNSAITKTGTWSNVTSSNFLSKSLVQSLGNPMKSSTAGNTLSFTIYDNNFWIGTYGYATAASYGSFSVTIDGVLQINKVNGTTAFSGKGYASAFTSQINTYDPRSPIVFGFTNLGIGTHTVVITLLQNLETDFDYIGKMVPPSRAQPMMVWHVTKRTPAGYTSYSDVGGGPAGIDSINRNIDTVCNFFRSIGMPVATIKSNDYLNNSMFYTDGLHLILSGHNALTAAGLYYCVTPQAVNGDTTLTTGSPGLSTPTDKTILTHPISMKNAPYGNNADTIAHSIADTLYFSSLVDSSDGPGLSFTDSSSLNTRKLVHHVNAMVPTTIAQLTAANYSKYLTFYTTDKGKQGPWVCDTTDASTASDGIITIVDAGSKRWKRPLTGNIIEASWAGVVADGVTNNTFPIKSLWPIANGKRVHFTGGVILLDSMPLPSLSNVEIYGDGDTTHFTVNSGDDLMYATNKSLKTIYVHDMFLDCNFSYTPADYGRGLVFFQGCQIDGMVFDRVKFRMPFANATAFNIVTQANTIPGQTKNVFLDHIRADSIGNNVVSWLNRDTTGSAALAAGTLPIEQTGYDSLKRCYFTNSVATNTGLMGSDGSVITMDGVGYDVALRNISMDNNYLIAIENTGFWYATFDGLHFKNSRHVSTDNWAFSSRLMKYNIIENCQDMDSMTQPAAFKYLNNSTFINNIFKSPGKFTDCNNNIITNDIYTGNLQWALSIISDPGNTSTGNNFINVTVNNAPSTSSPSAIILDGKGVTNNTFTTPTIIPGKSGGDTYFLLKDTASVATNFIFNADYGGAAPQNSFRAVTLPTTNTKDTASAMDDINNWGLYQFSGTISQPDTFYFQSKIHTNFVVRNNASNSVFVQFLGGLAGVTVPSSGMVNIVSDSIGNLRANTTTFGSNVITGNTVQISLNSGSTTTIPQATTGGAGVVDASHYSTLDSLKNRTITGFGGGSVVAGSYTPSVNDSINVSSFSFQHAYYSVDASTILHVKISGTLVPTTGSSQCTMTFTLPSSYTSTTGSGENVGFGVVQFTTGASGTTTAIVQQHPQSNKVTVNFPGLFASGANFTISFDCHL
jgi:hypothetical protein